MFGTQGCHFRCRSMTEAVDAIQCVGFFRSNREQIAPSQIRQGLDLRYLQSLNDLFVSFVSALFRGRTHTQHCPSSDETQHLLISTTAMLMTVSGCELVASISSSQVQHLSDFLVDVCSVFVARSAFLVRLHNASLWQWRLRLSGSGSLLHTFSNVVPKPVCLYTVRGA